VSDAERLAPHHPLDQAVGETCGGSAESEIEVAVEQPLLLLATAAAAHLEPQRGKSLAQPGQNRARRDQVGLQNVDPQDLVASRCGSRLRDAGTDGGECVSSMRQKGLAGGGQRHPARRPLEQLGPELGLQPADLIAEGRLGHVQPAGGGGEVQLLCHHQEVPHQP
jgi:hypothetical protein